MQTLDQRHGRRLLLAGLIDSFGLSLGWTTFTLVAVERYGLSAAALYNAAMLIGIVISAPTTMWLSKYLSGGTLLRLVGGIEMPLRLATLAALLVGAPSALISLGIVVMNVAAWTGYAGMRAEVAHCEPGAKAMVRYAVAIASIEAVAASVAALLPVTAHSFVGRLTLAVVFVLYGASLAPQFWCAHHARVRSGTQLRAEIGAGHAMVHVTVDEGRAPTRSRMLPILLAGASIMVIASGPATLNTALAADLYGRFSVIVASIGFTLGCLSATPITAYVARFEVSTRALWTVWGIGMLIGWAAAPLSVVAMVIAQLLSGLSLTAFHGEMDAVISRIARPDRLTTLLAVGGALRAIGSAVSVRLLPILVSKFDITGYTTGLLAVLVLAAASTGVVSRFSVRGRHRVGRVRFAQREFSS